MTAQHIPARCAAFRRLHEQGCFVIPNPWDAGSARYLESLGFEALATTSAGCAWSMGRPDGGVALDPMLERVASIAAAVAVPVSADFEGGFARAPEAVAANVARAVATGIAGLSIEDASGEPAQPLFELDFAVARIAAARAALDAAGSAAVLTARSEGYIVGRPDLGATIERLTAFADAGADCLYAPGLRADADIVAVVRAVAPKPVNVLVGSDFTSVAHLAGLGVRRISVGGALARTAWGEFMRAAQAIAEHGQFAAFGRAASLPALNALFEGR